MSRACWPASSAAPTSCAPWPPIRRWICGAEAFDLTMQNGRQAPVCFLANVRCACGSAARLGLLAHGDLQARGRVDLQALGQRELHGLLDAIHLAHRQRAQLAQALDDRSEEHTSELQSRQYLVCRLLLEKK